MDVEERKRLWQKFKRNQIRSNTKWTDAENTVVTCPCCQSFLLSETQAKILDLLPCTVPELQAAGLKYTTAYKNLKYLIRAKMVRKVVDPEDRKPVKKSGSIIYKKHMVNAPVFILKRINKKVQERKRQK